MERICDVSSACCVIVFQVGALEIFYSQWICPCGTEPVEFEEDRRKAEGLQEQECIESRGMSMTFQLMVFK